MIRYIIHFYDFVRTVLAWIIAVVIFINFGDACLTNAGDWEFCGESFDLTADFGQLEFGGREILFGFYG